jgi:hypothetical protein
MIAQLPAIFSKITSRADRSYKLEFESRELSGQDANTLLGLLQHEGYLLFSPNPLQEADIPTEKANSGTDTKSPSKRLRDRLAVYYINVKKGERHNFEIWYAAELERIGEKYLEKLND